MAERGECAELYVSSNSKRRIARQFGGGATGLSLLDGGTFWAYPSCHISCTLLPLGAAPREVCFSSFGRPAPPARRPSLCPLRKRCCRCACSASRLGGSSTKCYIWLPHDHLSSPFQPVGAFFFELTPPPVSSSRRNGSAASVTRACAASGSSCTLAAAVICEV